MTKPVFVALDLDSEKQLASMLSQLGPAKNCSLKIGMELYYRAGNELIEKLARAGYNLFLDLKLHDIPNTVYQAAKAIAKLGINYTTVHALGGAEMIKEAKAGLADGCLNKQNCPRLLAVTELTSISPQVLAQQQNCRLNMTEQVISLAKTAKKAGADGVICSALEVEQLRQNLGSDFLYVTPGIRPQGAATNDQSRVATPAQAKKWGASALVIGRPITQATNPASAYQNILKEFN